MGFFDSIAQKAAEIQKAASEVADAAAQKAAEIQKTAEEAAASASTIAGQAVDAIQLWCRTNSRCCQYNS